MNSLAKDLLAYLNAAYRAVIDNVPYHLQAPDGTWEVWTLTRFGRLTGRVAVRCDNTVIMHLLAEAAANDGFKVRDTRKPTVKHFSLARL